MNPSMIYLGSPKFPHQKVTSFQSPIPSPPLSTKVVLHAAEVSLGASAVPRHPLALADVEDACHISLQPVLVRRTVFVRSALMRDGSVSIYSS